MLEVLNVILDVLGILAIICLGAFVVVLIGDLILSTFDGHEGVFFHKSKKQKYDDQTAVNNAPQSNEPTVVPYYQTVEEPVVEEPKEEVVSAVDFQKAADEQKMLQSRGIIKEPAKVDEPMFTDIEDEEDTELADAIKETTKVALDQIASEEEQRKQEELARKQKEEQERLEKERLEQERLEQERLEKERLEQEKAKKPEKEIVYVQAPVKEEDPSVKELRKLREDIFSLRRSAFKDLQEAKESNEQNEIIQTKREYNRQIKAKLKELDELKLDKDNLNAEKEELLKYKKVALDRKNELELMSQEREQLERELEELRSRGDSNQKPYYSREYYENKLAELEAELKETEKDLRSNKREFIPLQRIKKSYDRDQEKLRRKEAIVAKQKVAIYGSKNSANVDPKRKEKLEEDVKVLKELKESVFHCEQVLTQNKDRYPVLEKANQLLTKTYNRLLQDIENVKTAIAWYDENEGNN
ncbi:MAG TPA: hypothetical protein DD621_02210 [Clostridiales bacterium]|nr:hypothetical protein [Clostridiales bacterium]